MSIPRTRLTQRLLYGGAGVEELAGSMAGEASGVLSLAVRHTLAGAMDAEGGGVLALTIPSPVKELSGSMDAEGGGVLDLGAYVLVAGVMAGVADGVLDLGIIGQEDIAGVMAGEPGGALSLTQTHALSGQMDGVAGGVLQLRATHPLPGEHYPPGVHVIAPVNHAATLRVGDTALFLFPSAGIESMAALCRVLSITYRTGDLVAGIEIQKLEDATVPTFSRATGVAKPQVAQNTPAKRIARAGRLTTRSGRRIGEPGRGH